MRLNNKVLATLVTIWVLFLCISYLGAYQYLMKGFLKLEQEEIIKNSSRVREAIEQISYSLGTYTVDWSHWNDAYDFIEGINPQFVPNNIDTLALANSNINLLLYLDKAAKIVVGVSIDLKKRQLVGYPGGLENYIYPGSPLLKHVSISSNVRGMMLLSSGIMLVVSAGTSHNDLTKPINGTLITGRLFSPELLQKISNSTRLQLQMWVPKQITANPKLTTIYAQTIDSDQGTLAEVVNNKIANGYLLLRDVFQKPIGMIRLTVPRVIVQTGKETIHYYLAIFFMSGVILLLVIWYLLRVLVLNRLEQLNNQIGAISGKKDFSQRIIIQSNDELTSVAKQVNEMIGTIQQSHEQLKEQVNELSLSEQRLENTNQQLTTEIDERKQAQDKIHILNQELILAARRAGMADIASGVLHNVGNILNSVATSIAVMQEHTEQSRSAKLKEIANLLMANQNNIDHFMNTDPKGQKIIIYLTMLATAWADENAFIINEINNLDKNVNHIKHTITTQQSMSVGMTEECDVRTLIDEALVLNKHLYEDTEVQVIRDYQFTGLVVIDRVKLLHVLVNLIKNSLQAVIAYDQPNKRVEIQMLPYDDEQFMIKVNDSGGGISPENITKIFSYGFTTKKGGHGFGLHTSATFIQEIQGKMSAENNPQGGATFILILPIHQVKRERDNSIDSANKLQTEWEK